VAIFNEDTFLFWDEREVAEKKIREIQMMIVLIFCFFKMSPIDLPGSQI